MNRLAPLFVALTFVAAGCAASGTGPSNRSSQIPLPPFTSAQLREAIPTGTSMTHRLEVRGQFPNVRTTQFVATDDEGAEMRERMTSARGAPVGEPRSQRASWNELRDHAAFPPERTTRESTSCAIPAGHFDCWLYTVEGEGEDGARSIDRFYFAPSLPGPPVLFEQQLDGKVMFRMQLVADSRHETTSEDPR